MWSTNGAKPTPRATSRVTTSALKGRAALGISALPGLVGEHGLVGRDRPVPA